MPSLVEILRTLRNELGYRQCKVGTCVLYIEPAIDAWLISPEQFTQFEQRIDFIKEQFPDLSSQITLALEKKQSSELSEQEQKVVDVADFIHSGELYFHPDYYTETFHKTITQNHALEISEFAEPPALKQLGGRAQLATFEGIYPRNKLEKYLDLLTRYAAISPVDFAISLSDDTHRIAICYDHEKKRWVTLDLNNEIRKIPNEEASSTLADFIVYAFEDEKDDVTGFTSCLYTRGHNRALLQPLVEQFLKDVEFINLHDPSQQAAQHTSRHNTTLAWLAAENDDLPLLKTLTSGQIPIDLNEGNFEKKTITYSAAQAGNIDIISYLIDLRDGQGNPLVKLDQASYQEVTPLYVAAQLNHPAIVRLLLSAKNPDGTPRVDPNHCMQEGWTPAHIAAEKGNLEVLQILAEHHADLGRINQDESPLDFARDYNHPHAVTFLEAWEKAQRVPPVSQAISSYQYGCLFPACLSPKDPPLSMEASQTNVMNTALRV